MQTIIRKKFLKGFVTVLVVAALSAAPVLAMPQGAPASAPVTFNLCASAGSVTLPDSTTVPIWGFSLDTGSGCPPAQIPGPVLDVNAGDVVTINLIDNLGGVTLEFPGQVVTGSYTFTAGSPGTYLYGSADPRGLLMGLYGALIVRPATPGQAYNGSASAYDTEATLVLSEIDPDFNANPSTFNTVNYSPKYWLINGSAYPQTANVLANAGDRVLLRYINAGSFHHTMSLLGVHQRIIGRDGYEVGYPYQVVRETIPAGSTLDAIATIPAGASAGTKFPLYSRQLRLNNAADFPGGMLTYLEVPAGCTNTPPTVSAGADQSITLPASAALDGTLTDDGCATVATTWTKQSGPGTVTFGNPNAVDTTASFSAGGTYVLRLTAVDDGFVVYDEMQVTVSAPVDVVFADDFESGDFSAWTSAVNPGSRINVTSGGAQSGTYQMSALISGGTSGYVRDASPVNETSYHARFYVNPNSALLGGDKVIFVGLNTKNAVVFRVQMRLSGGNYQVRLQVTRSGGTTTTSRFTISNSAYHAIEIAWQSGTSAFASLYIDGVLKQTLSGLNTSSYKLDSVRLGLPASGLGTASGTLLFDNFQSSRSTYIGP